MVGHPDTVLPNGLMKYKFAVHYSGTDSGTGGIFANI
jgi:hypothetical protein